MNEHKKIAYSPSSYIIFLEKIEYLCNHIKTWRMFPILVGVLKLAFDIRDKYNMEMLHVISKPYNDTIFTTTDDLVHLYFVYFEKKIYFLYSLMSNDKPLEFIHLDCNTICLVGTNTFKTGETHTKKIISDSDNKNTIVTIDWHTGLPISMSEKDLEMRDIMLRHLKAAERNNYAALNRKILLFRDMFKVIHAAKALAKNTIEQKVEETPKLPSIIIETMKDMESIVNKPEIFNIDTFLDECEGVLPSEEVD